MKTIEIFDPAMCCSTGVCGPSVNKELLRIATIIEALKKMGIHVTRHNLSSEPQAFIQNTTVNQLLRAEGADVLPVTLVDGEVAVKGGYPTTAQMSEWTGRDLRYIPLPTQQPCCDTSGDSNCSSKELSDSDNKGETSTSCCCGPDRLQGDCC
jgi:hypothetical protein